MSDRLESFKLLYNRNDDLNKEMSSLEEQVNELDSRLDRILEEYDCNDDKRWEIYEQMTSGEQEAADAWINERMNLENWDDELESWVF